MKYIIKDWVGNILDFKGRINSKEFAVPMEFESFEDANEYVVEHFKETDWDEMHVEELKGSAK